MVAYQDASQKQARSTPTHALSFDHLLRYIHGADTMSCPPTKARELKKPVSLSVTWPSIPYVLALLDFNSSFLQLTSYFVVAAFTQRI